MIKIELNEKLHTKEGLYTHAFENTSYVNEIKDIFGFVRFNPFPVIKSITNYIPTQDITLDRSFILYQLGISKEQDEKFQLKYKNL